MLLILKQIRIKKKMIKRKVNVNHSTNQCRFNKSERNLCTVCGRNNHNKNSCFYKDCECHICHRKGHLATVFRDEKKNFENRNLNKNNN